MKKKFFKKVICLLSVLLILASIIIIPINASNTAETESETIWDKYPFLNIIPFDYASASGVYDNVEVVVNNDGTISTYGTATTTASFFTVIVLYDGEGFEIPEYVTFSCSGLANGASILIRFSDDDKYFIFDKDQPITFNKKDTKINRIAIRIRNNDKLDDTMTLAPMLNAGTVAYPYQTNINALLNQYYQGGYDNAMQKADCKYNAEIENSDEYADAKITATNMAKLLYPDLSTNDLTWFIRGYCDKAMDLGFHYNCCAEHNSFYLSGWDQIKIDNADEFYNSGYNVGNTEGFNNGYNVGTGIDVCTWKELDLLSNPNYLKEWTNALNFGSNKYKISGKELNLYAQGYADYSNSVGFHFSCCAEKNYYYLRGYLDNFYEDSFNNGYTNGYDKCYEEQMAKNNTHIFTDATYTAHVFVDYFTGAGEQKIASITFEPNRYQNSIDFANLLDILNNSNIDTKGYYLDEILTRVEIEINWPTEKAFDLEKFPIYIYGSSDVSYGTITNTNNKTYAINANYAQNTRKFVVEEAGANIKQMVKRMTIRVGRACDLLNEFTLLSESEAYNVGYNEGYESGSKNGESSGYQKGYSNGFMQGKDEGLKLKENSNWRELMNAIVEAPVNTFRSLFNFEILGLDMRAAFGSVLALCMLLLIIKKVIL